MADTERNSRLDRVEEILAELAANHQKEAEKNGRRAEENDRRAEKFDR